MRRAGDLAILFVFFFNFGTAMREQLSHRVIIEAEGAAKGRLIFSTPSREGCYRRFVLAKNGNSVSEQFVDFGGWD